MNKIEPIHQAILRSVGKLGSGNVLIPGGCSKIENSSLRIDSKWREERIKDFKEINIQVSGRSVLPLALVDSSFSKDNNKELALYGSPIVHMFLRSWTLQTLSGYNHTDVSNVLSSILNPGILTFAYTGLAVSRQYLCSDEMKQNIEDGFASGEATHDIETFFSTQLYALVGGIYLELGLPAAFDFLSISIAPELVTSLED